MSKGWTLLLGLGLGFGAALIVYHLSGRTGIWKAVKTLPNAARMTQLELKKSMQQHQQKLVHAPKPIEPKFDFYTVLPHLEVPSENAKQGKTPPFPPLAAPPLESVKPVSPASVETVPIRKKATASATSPPLTHRPTKPKQKPSGSSSTGPRPTRFYVHAGSYQHYIDADALKARLALQGLNPQIISTRDPSGSSLYRIVFGPYSKEQVAVSIKKRLENSRVQSIYLVKQQVTP